MTQAPSFVPGRAHLAPLQPDAEIGFTVPRNAYDQLPETQWRVDREDPRSVYTDLSGSEMAVLPGNTYAQRTEGVVQQELLGVVEAGEEYLAILGVRTPPRYGKTFATNYVVVRFDPTGKRYEQVVVGSVPRADQGGLRVGRNTPQLATASKEMSREHFDIAVHDTEAGSRVVVTDLGSSNGTRVLVPNSADYRGKESLLADAWGGDRHYYWALRPEVAKDLRPSVMRPLPPETADDQHGRPPERTLLHEPGTHQRVGARMDTRLPLETRRQMRLGYGLDAALIATIELAPGPEDAERLFVIDRGEIPYGEEYSLFPGGRLFGHDERYIVVDREFMAAARYAVAGDNFDILQQHIAQHGGMRILNQRQSSTMSIGRANWRDSFGQEAGARVERNTLVSGQHVDLTIGQGVGAEIAIVDRGSTNGTEVTIGARRPVATAHAAGAAMLGPEDVTNLMTVKQ